MYVRFNDDEMVSVTVRVPEKLKKEMRRLKHVNWSEVIRKSIEERVRLEQRARGKDRAAATEASRMMNELFEHVRKRYGTMKYDSAQTVRLSRDQRYSASSQTPR